MGSDRPGALRLAAMEGQRRNGSVVHDVLEPGGILPGHITEHSLELPEDLTWEEWSAVGATLRRVNVAWRWWLGDFLLYGDRRFGEMASQIEDELGVDYQQAADCRWVASRIPVSRRRERLSWSHHREVAKLDADRADELLDQAEKELWPRSMLRVAARTKEPVERIELACQCQCHNACQECGHEGSAR